MLFSDIEYGFQEAFLAAWNAYKRGSMPIGAAILNDSGVLMARGENSIYAADKNEIVSGHRLAHAELNAILKVNGDEHPNINSYTLYATMEPCAMCYGAIVHGNLKRVKFAMRDNLFGGARAINSQIDIFLRQNINISGPSRELEMLSIILIVYRRLCYGFSHNETYFKNYAQYCPGGLEIGHSLYEDSTFKSMLSDNCSPIKIYDYILKHII